MGSKNARRPRGIDLFCVGKLTDGKMPRRWWLSLANVWLQCKVNKAMTVVRHPSTTLQTHHMLCHASQSVRATTLRYICLLVLKSTEKRPIGTTRQRFKEITSTIFISYGLANMRTFIMKNKSLNMKTFIMKNNH